MSLESVMDALAALPVVANDVNVTGLANDALVNNPTRAKLPVRILSPLMIKDDGQSMRAMAFDGRSGRVDWTISDLYLVAQGTSGRGMESHMLKLTRVADGYADFHRANYKLARNTKITGLRIQIGVSSYPRGTREEYFVVQAIWDVTEVI